MDACIQHLGMHAQCELGLVWIKKIAKVEKSDTIALSFVFANYYPICAITTKLTSLKIFVS